MIGTLPSTDAVSASARLSRGHKKIQDRVQRGGKALAKELERLAREGKWDEFDRLILQIIEVIQGTARLTASSRRLELASYILIGETAVLALLTFLLWTAHF